MSSQKCTVNIDETCVNLNYIRQHKSTVPLLIGGSIQLSKYSTIRICSRQIITLAPKQMTTAEQMTKQMTTAELIVQR